MPLLPAPKTATEFMTQWHEYVGPRCDCILCREGGLRPSKPEGEASHEQTKVTSDDDARDD